MGQIKTSNMQLFLRQVETRVILAMRSSLHQVRADLEREVEREDTGQASPNRTWPSSSQEARQTLAPGQARGLLIPCFNLTSIIRMPDSASNVKIVLGRVAKDQVHLWKRAWAGGYPRGSTRARRGGRRVKKEARQQ
jgi:hypothetical protein